jgi:hypothetical protein
MAKQRLFFTPNSTKKRSKMVCLGHYPDGFALPTAGNPVKKFLAVGPDTAGLLSPRVLFGMTQPGHAGKAPDNPGEPNSKSA